MRILSPLVLVGLTFALSVAERGSVAVITKKNRAESNTNYAQGRHRLHDFD